MTYPLQKATFVTSRDLAGPCAWPRRSRGLRRLTVLLAPPFAALVRHGCGTAYRQVAAVTALSVTPNGGQSHQTPRPASARLRDRLGRNAGPRRPLPAPPQAHDHGSEGGLLRAQRHAGPSGDPVAPLQVRAQDARAEIGARMGAGRAPLAHLTPGALPLQARAAASSPGLVYRDDPGAGGRHEPARAEPVVGGVRGAAGVAGVEDGVGRAGLAGQHLDAGEVDVVVRDGALRVALRGARVLGRSRVLLT